MEMNGVFDRYSFDPARAVGYGFVRDGGVYRLRRPLPEPDFYVVFTVDGSTLTAQVYEEPDGEPYLPYDAAADVGSFVSRIRALVDEERDRMVDACFTLADGKALLLRYVKERYGTEPEAPWGEYEAYHTLNTAVRHKWYGLFMLIPYRTLGIQREGKIHVLNLKARPEDIPALIDGVHYFPAYHMNKKHWLTVLLDRTADLERIERLLDDSYALAEGQSSLKP